MGLAVGILVGAALQLVMQLPALAKLGMRFRPDVNFDDPGVKKVGKLMVPMFFGMGVFQINFFVDTIFAASSRMPEGSIRSLYIADRVMELVLGSYAIALSTALLPTMSHQAAEGKHDEMKQTFGFALRVASFITIPAAVGLILLRVPDYASALSARRVHGAFHGAHGSRAAVLFAGTAGVRGHQIDYADVLLDARHADADESGSLCSLVLHVALNFVLLFGFGRYLWNASPALASSLAAYFNFAALFLIFRGRYGSLGAAAIFSSLGKMALCAVAMSAVCFAALKYSHLADAGAFSGESRVARRDHRRFVGNLFRLGLGVALRGIAGIVPAAAARGTKRGSWRRWTFRKPRERQPRANFLPELLSRRMKSGDVHWNQTFEHF